MARGTLNFAERHVEAPVVPLLDVFFDTDQAFLRQKLGSSIYQMKLSWRPESCAVLSFHVTCLKRPRPKGGYDIMTLLRAEVQIAEIQGPGGWSPQETRLAPI